jgi:hypothetical protein
MSWQLPLLRWAALFTAPSIRHSLSTAAVDIDNLYGAVHGLQSVLNACLMNAKSASICHLAVVLHAAAAAAPHAAPKSSARAVLIAACGEPKRRAHRQWTSHAHRLANFRVRTDRLDALHRLLSDALASAKQTIKTHGCISIIG